MNKKSWLEMLPYPKGWMQWLYKTPILLYWLGLGFLVGRLFMILTTSRTSYFDKESFSENHHSYHRHSR
jgi:hypothetical protein